MPHNMLDQTAVIDSVCSKASSTAAARLRGHWPTKLWIRAAAAADDALPGNRSELTCWSLARDWC